MEWLAGESGLRYGDLCLKAALDTETFKRFRSHDDYTPILEHVDANSGAHYLKIILEKGYSLDYVIEAIKPLQHIGSPRLADIGIGRPVSTTALRYFKVASDIIDQCGKDLGHVTEIGCGYGGQAIILSQLASIDHYTFIDMWQVNLLIQRFIEESSFRIPYDVKTIRQAIHPYKSDLLISNYAFSELDIELQSLCVNKFMLSSRRGYLTMNTGLKGLAFNNQDDRHISSEHLLSLLPKSRITKEVPLTSPSNYIITW